MTLCATLSMQAQFSQFTIGARGGVDTYLPQKEVNAAMGAGGGVELRYSLLWTVGYVHRMGFSTGGTFAYRTPAMQVSPTYHFSTTDYNGDEIRYTISLRDAREQIRLMEVQVPLMVAMQFGNLRLNVGGRVDIPLMGHSTQQFKQVDIEATYPLYGVTISNELITGKVTPGTRVEGAAATTMRVAAGLDINYEWVIGGHRNYASQETIIGVGAYAFSAVWTAKTPLATYPAMVEVSPIQNAADPAAKVQLHPISQVYPTALLPIEAGVRMYCSFEFSHRYSSRRHRNRYVD